MINDSDGELREYCARKLRMILGPAVDMLDGYTLGIMEQVVLFEEGISEDPDGIVAAVDRRKEYAQAIWTVVREDYWDLAALCKTKNRKREVVDLRTMMYRAMQQCTCVPKSRLAAALGLKQNHATVLNCLSNFETLYRYDRAFRKRYDAFLAKVKGQINNNTERK